MKSRCDSITNITLLYRQVDTDAFKAVHIRPGETSHHVPVLKHVNYEVKLRIQNNEGYASTSDIIKVGSKREYGGCSPISAIYSCSSSSIQDSPWRLRP